MPYAVCVDPESRLGMVCLSGRVTGGDLIAANEVLYGDAAWSPGFDELWDCRAVEEMVVEIEHMRAIVAMESAAESPAGPEPTTA